MRLTFLLPYLIGSIFGLLMLNLWYLSALAIENRIVPTTYDYFLRAIIVLAAAFFGSCSAFYLNHRKDRKKVVEGQVDALNSALFVTLQQINALLLVKRSLSEFEGDPLRFYNMPPVYTSDYSNLKTDIKRLEFMLRDDANLLFQLAIEQNRFENAVRITNMRADFHLNDLQMAISDAKFNVENPTLKELYDVLGPRVLGTIKRSTDNMYEQVSESVDSITEIHEKLHVVAKEMFPEFPIVKFEIDV